MHHIETASPLHAMVAFSQTERGSPMIKVGQYVRAILAEGIAAALPELEGFEAQLDREGLVVQLRPALNTFVLEDFFGNEHICHVNGAVIVDLAELDEYQRGEVTKRIAQLQAETP